ncbi:hypothetical protein Purlil1_11622 [Purpureocillium lilacinum]|uniref:SUI1 domain-containing protein n=6 Tax=Hypocreomycetidae TaxID=222543 RepID=A0ABR0BJ18_PURLI|nr:hypothetical protein Purlil1_11622 [Purpureocillium lilacinum]
MEGTCHGAVRHANAQVLPHHEVLRTLPTRRFDGVISCTAEPCALIVLLTRPGDRASLCDSDSDLCADDDDDDVDASARARIMSLRIIKNHSSDGVVSPRHKPRQAKPERKSGNGQPRNGDGVCASGASILTSHAGPACEVAAVKRRWVARRPASAAIGLWPRALGGAAGKSECCVSPLTVCAAPVAAAALGVRPSNHTPTKESLPSPRLASPRGAGPAALAALPALDWPQLAGNRRSSSNNTLPVAYVHQTLSHAKTNLRSRKNISLLDRPPLSPPLSIVVGVVFSRSQRRTRPPEKTVTHKPSEAISSGLSLRTNCPPFTKPISHRHPVTSEFMSIENLKTYDPFAEADEDTGETKQTQNYIHIRIQQRNGRKTLTTVQGLPKKFDQKKILKVIKKKFACNGTIVNDTEMGEVIQLQGDQRKDVQEFLVDKKEGLELDPKTIKVHGF